MKIVKVISVVDTREYEEQGDMFVPIPGSGNPSECSRCGRTHEVHWTVLLDNQTQAIVGGSCAKASAMDAAAVRSGESAAKKIGALTKEIASLKKRLVDLQAHVAAVDTLPLPAVTFGSFTSKSGEIIKTAHMGDADVWMHGTYDSERASCLTNSWKAKRVSERTSEKACLFTLNQYLKQAEASLAKATKKISELVS